MSGAQTGTLVALKSAIQQRTAKVGVIGLGYVPNRDQSYIRYIDLDRVADYCGPLVPTASRGRKHDLGLSSVLCTCDEFARYDAVLVSTAHAQFKEQSLYDGVRLVIDTRNIITPRDGMSLVRA